MRTMSKEGLLRSLRILGLLACLPVGRDKKTFLTFINICAIMDLRF